MKVRIYITLKNGVLDPQGRAIENALQNLGVDYVENIRQGKLIEVELQGSSKPDAEKKINYICSSLLVNKVIEDYTFDIL